MNAIDTTDSRYFGFVLAVVLKMPRTPAHARLAKRALEQLTEATLLAVQARGGLAPLASCARERERGGGE